MSDTCLLSALQQSYLLGKLGYSGDYIGCHTYTEFSFKKELNLNVDKINKIWNKLIVNHPMLRMSIDENGRQYIRKFEEYAFTKSVNLKRTREKLANKIYLQTEYPLYTIVYTELSDSIVFHFSIDSMIVDFYSVNLLFEEMYKAYYDEEIYPEKQDFFEWYRLWKLRRNIIQEDYWKNKLKRLDLKSSPLQYKKAKIDNMRYREFLVLDENLAIKIKAYCRSNGFLLTTFFTYIFAKTMLERLDIFRINIVNTLSNRQNTLGNPATCVGPLTNTEIVEITKDTTISELSNEIYRDLENSDIELSELLQRNGEPVYLPFVMTVNMGEQSVLSEYKVFEISQTPNVEIENIISSRDKEIVWELNYSNRFFDREEIVDLLSEIKGQVSYILTSQLLELGCNTDKMLLLNELQMGYALDNLKYGQANYVFRKFQTQIDSVLELDSLLELLVNRFVFLSCEISQFSQMKITNKLMRYQLQNLDDILKIADLNSRPIEVGYHVNGKNLEVAFIFSMVYLNSSSIIYLIDQIGKLLRGKKFAKRSISITSSYFQDNQLDDNYWRQKFKQVSVRNSFSKVDETSEPLKRRSFTFGMWDSVETECLHRAWDPDDIFIAALINALSTNGIISQFYPVVLSSTPNILYEEVIDDSKIYWIAPTPSSDLYQQSLIISNTRYNDLINYSSNLFTWLRNNKLFPSSQVVITDCRAIAIEYQEEVGWSKSSGISLDIVLTRNEFGVQIEWNYLEVVYGEEILNRIENDLRGVLINILKSKGKQMKEAYTIDQMRSYLKYGKGLSKENFKKVIYDFNETKSNYSYERLIYEGFDENVLKNPDKIAVITDDDSVTYKELSDMVKRISDNLSVKVPTIIPGSVIAIALDRSIEMVAILIAILKLRCAYLPLSITDGYRRVEEIINDANPIAIISDGSLNFNISHPCIIDSDSLNKEVEGKLNLVEPGQPEDLAYIIFTSGSTGKPKGVQINHRSIVNLFSWMENTLKLNNFGKVLAVNPLNFDLSVFDIFGTLHLGGTIRLLASQDRLNIFRIIEIIRDEQISLWNSTPAYLKMITDEMGLTDAIFTYLKYILLSGDWIPVEIIPKIYKLFPNCQFIALGGATEAAVWSNYYNVKDFKEEMTSVPYGYPICNTKYYILKEDLTPCDIGEVGNLYISGICLSVGYLNDIEKNKGSFLENPYDNNLPYQKIYKTGDLAKFLADGTIIFYGRKDNQIEINGYRIELGEIDSCFKTLGLKDSITLYSDKELVVFTTTHLSDIEKQQLKEQSRDYLATYMVPNRIISIPEIPITANGKVDRKNLEKWKREISIDKRNDMKSETPSSSFKDFLFKACSQIISREITEEEYEANLGDLGFTSLQFALLSSKINQEIGEKVNPTLFYKYDSIKKIVMFLAEKTSVNRITEMNKDRNEKLFTRSNTFLPYEKDDIAIVGLSARMPDAADEIEFFNNLIQYKDTTKEIPINRWSWEEFYGEEGQGAIKTKVRMGHFMKDIDVFDRKKFKLSPHEVRMMDPRQRILLEETGNLLLKSGYGFNELRGQDIGVFLGATGDEYYNLLINQNKEINSYSMIGTSRTILANRISYFFNWHGPSEVVDTACSSSLVALHNAILSLKNGDCSKAIVGGINIIIDPLPHIGLAETGMLSPDGKCKTFDNSANGYGRGEGVGLILLETVQEAIKNSDNILCVIKRSAVNHGGKANSLTSPNISAQSTLLKKCYESLDLDVRKLKYIEMHGTGTALGDPIEIEALKEALSNKIKEGQVGLGAVKTNIGHLEAAAGIAAVIKCVMSYRVGVFPANLGPNVLNSNIDLEDTPFYPVKENQILFKNEVILMGVSSFGFGGTNAHVVLGGVVNE